MSFSYTVQQGDTLNSIAQRHGFKNYRDAGISDVPSGNFDLIKAGEQVTLGNYDPNNIRTFGSGSPVVSSVDNKAEFMQNSDKITGIDNAFQSIYSTKETDKTKTDTTKTETTTDTQTTGDPVYDELQKNNKAEEESLRIQQDQKKADYSALYETSLANLDATTLSTINSINSTYDKRIKEQERINKLNIDRTKAYGLANGGQYAPLDFGDAVSTKEIEASDKIKELENERISLIQKAKSARDSGKSALLRQNLQDLDKVDTDIRNQLKEVQSESEKKYKMLRDIRIDQEKQAKERKDKVVKQISDLAPMYSADYEKMTPDEKNTFIQQLVTKTGVDYATIYSTLEAGMLKGKKDQLGLQKDQIAVKTAWNKANGTTPTTKKVTPEQMSADAPESFASDADFKSKMTAFVRKYGSQGATYWDKVYQKDNVGDYVYTIATEKKKSSVSTPKAEDLRKKYDY